MRLGYELNEITDEEWAELAERGYGLKVDTTFKGLDALGQPVFSAKWTTVPIREPQTGAEEEYDDYWSPENVEERNRRREESWEWYHAKELEGWAEYYKVLQELKLPPYMDEYFSSPARFNELRRIWETTAKHLSWEGFLRQYDFMAHWYRLSPRERGERPTAFAPPMTAVSEL